MLLITGTPFDDLLPGTDQSDVIVALAGNDTLEGGARSDTLRPGEGDDLVDGGTGKDTVSYSDLAAGVSVVLAFAGPQDTLGAGIDTIVNVENVEGGSGDDSLTGNSAANVLTGSGGNDALIGLGGNDLLVGGFGDDLLRPGMGNDTADGGPGSDTVSYADLSLPVALNLAIATPQVTGAGIETLLDIENAEGGSGADILIGTDAANRLAGNSGSDTLVGLGGNDQLFGGASNDLLRPGVGDDLVDGGSGIDMVSYAELLAAIVLELANPLPQDTLGAGIETIVKVENAEGGAGADRLTGTGGANLLGGGLGSDTLSGLGGNDTLVGGEGNDLLRPGTGDDVADGGAGTDTVSYRNVSAAVRVDLGIAAPQDTAGAGIDQLIDIENAEAGTGNDTLVGSALANTLAGGAGNDRLDGLDGPDRLAGGAGADTFVFHQVPAAGAVDLVTDLETGIDRMELDNAGGQFGDLLGGLLPAAALDILGDAQAPTASTRLVYAPITGTLSFDADGNGDGEALRIAMLQSKPALRASDIVVTGIAGPPQVIYVDELDIAADDIVGALPAGPYNLPTTELAPEPPNGAEVAALADGGHVVTMPDGTFVRYDAGGTAVGAAQVFAEGSWAGVAGLKNGSFVFSWTGTDADGLYDVFSRRFNSDGTPAGDAVTVNQGLFNDQARSSIAELAGGGYVVSWQGFVAYNDDDIYARIYDDSGAPRTNEFVVNSNRAGIQLSEGDSAEGITGLAGGRLAVVWSTAGGGARAGVYSRVFEADGRTVNARDVKVSTDTPGGEQGSVGAVGTGFAVTWSAPDLAGGNGLYVQRFDAGGVKQGGAIRVDTLTGGDQLYAKVAGLADGSFVVVWQDDGLAGNDDIHGQRFDAAGSRVGGEFVVNPLGLRAGSPDRLPSVALRQDGALVAVWTDTTGFRVEQKIVDDFAADTTPIAGLGDERVAPTLGEPEVAALPGGGHAVVWSAIGSGATPDYLPVDVWMQRYDAGGARLGAAQTVGTAQVGLSNYTAPGVAALGDGSVVVTWSAFDPFGSDYGVLVRHYGVDGYPAGDAVAVNETNDFDQFGSNVAELANGGFVVTWQGDRDDNGDSDIYARVFDASAAPMGGEFMVNTSTGGPQVSQSRDGMENVAGLPGGRFVVVWTGIAGADGTGGGVQMRLFEADGSAVQAAQAAVSTSPSAGQDGASVAPLGSGFIVNWTAVGRNGDGSFDVLAQRFDADGLRLGDEIVVNTLTTGDQHSGKAVELPDGGFVVMWTAYPTLAGAGVRGNADIHGQRFDAAGNKIGSEFVINDRDFAPTNADVWPSLALREDGALVVVWTDTGSEQVEQKLIVDLAADTVPAADGADQVFGEPVFNFEEAPQVAALAGGGHVVAWGAVDDSNPGDGNFGVFVQRFDPAGAAVGAPQLVDVNDENGVNAGVAGLGDGGFVVVWNLFADQVLARRYDAGGAPVGDELRVDESGGAENCNITALAGGGHAIAWTKAPAWPGAGEILVRVFDPSGQPLTGELAVQTTVDGARTTSSHGGGAIVGLAGGGFVVVWSDTASGDGSAATIQARVFGADGSPVGAAPVQVSHTTTYPQAEATVAAVGAGFVVTWMAPDDSGSGIFAQRFDGNGGMLGGEIAVNTVETGHQTFPKVQALADGSFVVLWGDSGLLGNEDIHGQHFDAGGNPLGGEFIVNNPAWDNASVDAYPSIALRGDGALAVVWLDAATGLLEQKIITELGDGAAPQAAADAAHGAADTFHFGWDASAPAAAGLLEGDGGGPMTPAADHIGAAGDDLPWPAAADALAHTAEALAVPVDAAIVFDPATGATYADPASGAADGADSLAAPPTWLPLVSAINA